MMRPQSIALAVFSVVAVFTTTGAAVSSHKSDARVAAKSVWDSVYTLDQAKRADSVYARGCAKCHGDALTGTADGPPLVGNDFMVDFNGSTAGDLYNQILNSMPRDEPNTVSPAAKIDILAVIFRENKFPAGSKELPTDTLALKDIKIEAVKK